MKDRVIDDRLRQNHRGPLKIIVHTLGGEVHQFTPDFDPKIRGCEATIFDYIGHACACIFTNLTTRLSVTTRLEHWEIIIFTPEEGVLEVRQVGGEKLEVEVDKFDELFLLELAETGLGPEEPKGHELN